MTMTQKTLTAVFLSGAAAGLLGAASLFGVVAPGTARADIPPSVMGGTPSLAPMLKTVLPAVVNISVVSKQEIRNPLLEDPFFRRFFGNPEQEQPQEREAQSIGSGVIVDAVKGYVLTNNHVVEQADTIKVRLNDEREIEAKLIGRDAATDIAVLQIKSSGLKALTMADSDDLEVGDFVVAVGSPFGLRQTVTSGIVSALSRQTGITGGGYEDFIQTDASINPGNSGGALVNLQGQLVGIPSNIYSRTGGNIGLGFAIPVNLAKSVMNQLVENGKVERGRIGITGQDLTPDLAKAFGLTTARGGLVSSVVAGSPAAKAGLKPEDVLLEANGRELENFAQLRNLVGLMRVGEKVELKILRDGKPMNLTVTIGKDTEQAAAGDKLHPMLAGATFAPRDESNSDGDQTGGVLVQAVAPRSAAARVGLRAKDIIIGINRRPVKNMAEFEKLAGVKGGELLLHIRRGNGALFLLLK